MPITGQTFAVLLVGASLGTLRGGSSALLYVLLGIGSAPVWEAGFLVPLPDDLVGVLLVAVR